MDTQDVFARVKARMLEGMVFHDEMARYYDFLGFYDMGETHRCRYHEETEGYIKLCDYYLHHHNRLIPQTPMERPDVIPDSWYMYARQDVDTGTKKSSVRNGMKKWVEWESGTKDLLEDMAGELLNSGEIADAVFLTRYITDVGKELKEANREHIRLESIGYDIPNM